MLKRGASTQKASGCGILQSHPIANNCDRGGPLAGLTIRDGDFTTTIRDVTRSQWPDFRDTKRIERFTDNRVRSPASTIQPDSAIKDDLMAASSRV